MLAEAGTAGTIIINRPVMFRRWYILRYRRACRCRRSKEWSKLAAMGNTRPSGMPCLQKSSAKVLRSGILSVANIMLEISQIYLIKMMIFSLVDERTTTYIVSHTGSSKFYHFYSWLEFLFYQAGTQLCRIIKIFRRIIQLPFLAATDRQCDSVS